MPAGFTICRMAAPRGFPSRPKGVSSAKSFSQDDQHPEFQQVLECLRTLVPTPLPVIVRTSRLPEWCYGECMNAGGHFLIRIARECTEDEAITTLLHEWAHGLAWNLAMDRLGKFPPESHAEFERLTHGPDWGVAFSRVYSTYASEILPLLG
jgi:hypothetical protein